MLVRTSLFGDKQHFAVDVGEPQEGELRRVDLWAAGRWLTCDDNVVYVPQFVRSVRATIAELRADHDRQVPFPGLSPAEAHRRLLERDDGSREAFGFLEWGPTTDNVLAHLFRSGDLLSICFELWRPTHPKPEERGGVFVAELPEAVLVSVLEGTLAALSNP